MPPDCHIAHGEVFLQKLCDPPPSSPPSPSNTHMHAFTQMSLHSCHSLCCPQTPCSAGGTRGSHCTSISTTARWGLPWHGRQQPRRGRKGGAQQCGGAWHQEEVDRVVKLCCSMSSIADIHSTMIGTLLGQACVAPLSVASDPSLEVYYNQKPF